MCFGAGGVLPGYHYKARVYDPILGRFLQTDPIGYQDDLNIYLYGRSDPKNLFDPDGRSAIAVHFRDQVISYKGWTIPQWLSGGHSGVVMIDDASGFTDYQEFGRYECNGCTRSPPVANLTLDRNGVPSARSIERLFSGLIGIGRGSKSRDIWLTFTYGSDFAAMQSEASRWGVKLWEPFTGSTCHGFADAVVEAGGDGPSITIQLSDENLGAAAEKLRRFIQEQTARARERKASWSIEGDRITGTRATDTRISR